MYMKWLSKYLIRSVHGEFLSKTKATSSYMSNYSKFKGLSIPVKTNIVFYLKECNLIRDVRELYTKNVGVCLRVTM